MSLRCFARKCPVGREVQQRVVDGSAGALVHRDGEVHLGVGRDRAERVARRPGHVDGLVGPAGVPLARRPTASCATPSRDRWGRTPPGRRPAWRPARRLPSSAGRPCRSWHPGRRRPACPGPLRPSRSRPSSSAVTFAPGSGSIKGWSGPQGLSSGDPGRLQRCVAVTRGVAAANTKESALDCH